MRKQILFGLTTLSAALVLFSACKKSDDSSGNTSIIGSWEVASSHYTSSINTTPPQTSTIDSNYTHGKSIVITFNTNNTYSEVDKSVTPNTTESGTYLTFNGKIATASTGSSPDTLNYTISNNVLTVSQSSSTTVGQFTETYTISESLNRQ